MDAFEQGIVTSFHKDRYKIPEIWKQLMDFRDKFHLEAGVEITDLGDRIIKLKDKYGAELIREKYEWENGL